MAGSAPLPFTLYPLPEGTSLSAHFASGQDRCGIYVLTHEDGSQYVGQAVDIVRRCADHVRRAGHAPGERILAVHFAPAPKADLDQLEQRVVTFHEDLEAKLRNKLLTGNPVGDSPLNATFDEAEQLAFLADAEDLASVDPVAATRPPRGVAMKPGSARLLARADAGIVLDVLAVYLLHALPAPVATEGKFWHLSAPMRLAGSGLWVLARLTVQNVGTLYVLEDPVQGVYATLNLAPRPVLPSGYGAQETDHYSSNGPMQQARLYPEVVLESLTGDPVFRTSARRAAVGLMRKGPSMKASSHDRGLADAVYARITAAIKEHS
ncbi:GIY-YIG nuclease family protein [Kocuria sp. M4R2S49]|uniref:GIY-YIG nuclease family protein n=1 Tax=Kocuria rhizosphaericola TaxID=3376284 RepID=UPI0037B33419